MELPNQHILCHKCLIKSNINNNNSNINSQSQICPICKTNIESTIEPRFIINMLDCFKISCNEEYKEKKCNWIGKAVDIHNHLKNCEILKLKNNIEIKEISNKMRDILSIEIIPHLKEKHLEIFNNYTKNFDWLEFDKRDWKWWWWSNLPWWNNNVCELCNILWHKYEDEIQIYENKRINIINYLYP